MSHGYIDQSDHSSLQMGHVVMQKGKFEPSAASLMGNIRALTLILIVSSSETFLALD